MEDYAESLAFIKLLNTAYQTFAGKLPDDGQSYQPYTEFVKNEVLGQLNQRGYRYSLSLLIQHSCQVL